ncbi:MAG: hypothetical protein JWO72_918 [Caulobacteraceae bacterium]|nr:hypothetical protein [Caulobacteraceae bacterium]
MSFFNRMPFVAGLAIAVLAAAPAFAHHSFAMFDQEKDVRLEGTVKEFQWTNPHCWVQLIVWDPATAKESEWSLEGLGPNGLGRNGWTKTSLKPGDKVSALIHPLRDGTRGGQMVTVTVGGKELVNAAH